MISAYLDSLDRALDFDRSLSVCVRQEVEDHLREAIAADPTDDGLDAERRAIAKFGDPQAIAAQFAVISLARQSRKVAAAVVLAVAGIFLLMKARLAWYGATQWVLSDHVQTASGVVLLIDRYAFLLSLLVGIAGWAYVSFRHRPASSCSAYRRRLRRFLLLSTAATGALIVSVISDGALTALRLLGSDLAADSLVPILSVAAEVAGAAILVVQVRTITRRKTRTTALLEI